MRDSERRKTRIISYRQSSQGDGNDNLNAMVSTHNGQTFGNKFIWPETSPQAPALAAHNGNLYIAWKGDGNDQQGSYSTFATRKSPIFLVGLKFI